MRDLTRIPGGASRETYRFDAEVGGQIKGMILRRDPVGGLIDTDRQTEFLAYRSFHGIVPVPEPLMLEPEGGALERPFFIMSRIDGGQVPSVMNIEPYGEHAATIGRELFAILGRIARCDPATLADQALLRGARPGRLLARSAGLLGQRDRTRRTPPAAYRTRRDPPLAPQST